MRRLQRRRREVERSDTKKEEWIRGCPCPDGEEECEVMHSLKVQNIHVGTPPPPPVLHHLLKPPPPSPSPPKTSEDNVIFARGMASAKQCYWSLITDAIVIAVIRYYLRYV